MGDQTKAFLYAWCGKSKITPHYDVKTRGPKHNQHFLCECRIDGYDYVGVGRSTRKKDAQTNAARDFLLYLIRKGRMSEEDVPEQILCPEDKPEGIFDSQDRPAGYHDRSSSKKRRLDEAEDPDVNAGIHGNWVLENAKARLHQFFQVNNIVAEYKYNQVGPDHNRSFICEMSFFSKKLGRSFSAREHGLNKQIASRACALSLVRQLYHLQVIEACSDVVASKGDKLEPHEVTVDAAVIEELDAVLEVLQVLPAKIPKDVDPKVPFLLQFGSKATEKKTDDAAEEKAEDKVETAEADEVEEKNLKESEEKMEEDSEETAEGSEQKIKEESEEKVDGSEQKMEEPEEKSEEKQSAESSEEKKEKSTVEPDASSQEETKKEPPTNDSEKSGKKASSSGKKIVKSEKEIEPPKESSEDLEKETEEKKDEEESIIEEEEIIQWFPPQRSRNPWTGNIITEGPFTKTLKQIGTELKKEHVRLEKTEAVSKMLEERKKLSIWESRTELLETIRNNTSVIVRGPAGSGKTTQVPQYILDSYLEKGHGAECSILVTQPRCLAAVSMAERIAEERGDKMGNSVGYITRFGSCLPRPYGSILFCTAGVLLKKLEYGFQGVSHVIVDEIQERDVNTDFIMMVLRDMKKDYPDIRIILMSGTVDTNIFQEYFSSCPIIEVSGKLNSVQEFFLEDCIQYLNFDPTLPTSTKKKKDDAEDESENMNKVIGDDYSESTKSTMAKLSEKEISFELIEAVLTCIETLSIPGTILVFLPGWNVISSFMKNLQEHPVFSGPSYLILPLHSHTTLEELHRVYKPADEGVTKIVLCTRIAESSITINNVVFVVNTCKEEIKFYTAVNNIASYVTKWASKSNLQQRKECASRNRAGFCFHLCSRARFEKLEDTIPPEICRSPLHELALAIRLHHLGYVGSYLGKALTPPPVDAIIQAETVLKEICALDKKNQVTSLGKVLACLPVDPRVGKMIVASFLFLLGDPLCIVATHSTAFPEPFDTVCPSRLTQVHQYFIGDRWSDHLTILNAFVQWQGAHALSKHAEASFCEQYSLSVPTMRAVNEAKNYLKKLLQDSNFPDSCMQEQYYLFNGPDVKLDMVAALLIMGYYPNICYHLDFQKVVTKEDKAAIIDHNSVNCTNQPPSFPSPFFVFGEKVNKTPVTCKQLTMVNPIHLLLFGCNKVELINGEVHLDGWINLKMDPKVACKILALRPPLESLLLEITSNPELLAELRPESGQLIDVVKKLCDRDAVTHRKYRPELPANYVEPPPKKQPKVPAEPKGAPVIGMQPGKRGRGAGPGRGRGDHDGEFGGFGFQEGMEFGRGRGSHPRGFSRGRGFGRGNFFNPAFQAGPGFDNVNMMQGPPFGSGFGAEFGSEEVGGSFPGFQGGPGFNMGGIGGQNDDFERELPLRRQGFGMAAVDDRSDIQGLRRGRQGFGDERGDLFQGRQRGRLGFDREDRDESFQDVRREGQGFGIERGRRDRNDLLEELRRRGFGREDRDDDFQRLSRGGIGRISFEDEHSEQILQRLQRLRREVELREPSLGLEDRGDLQHFPGDERDVHSFRRTGGFGIGDSRDELDDLRRQREDLLRRAEDRGDSPLGFMGIHRRSDDSPRDFRDSGHFGMLERDDSFPLGGNRLSRYMENLESRVGSTSGGRYMDFERESRSGFQQKSRDDYERRPFGRRYHRGRGHDFSDSDSEDERYWGRGIRRSFL